MKRILGFAAAGAGLGLLARAVLRRSRSCCFRNKNVLITGGSRGLGLVLARRLVDYGANVAICGRDPHELERARQEFLSRGQEVVTAICDVADRLAVETAIKLIRKKLGSIDVLINNAGLIQVGPQDETTLDDYEQAMRVHFWGPLYVTRSVLPAMCATGFGRIINIASLGGLMSVPHLLPYSASKSALVGLSEGLRTELLKYGVYVTTVCPGLMQTGSTRHAQFKGQHEAEYAWFGVAASSPLLAMDVERAAKQILEAARYGKAFVVIPWTAKIAKFIHGLVPGITSDTFGLVDRLLPGPGGTGSKAVPGNRSRPYWLPPILTRANDEAAQQHNEVQVSPQDRTETHSLSYAELEEPLSVRGPGT